MNNKILNYYNKEEYSLTEKVDQPIISNEELLEGYEKSELYDIEKIKEYFDSHDYMELPNIETDGNLLASYPGDDGKIKQVFLPKSHKIIVGTTGSGKTQSYILPYLKVVSSIKNNHSFCISDLKGELYQSLAGDLEKKGYNVYMLNFKNPLSSDEWNPFSIIYDNYVRIKNLQKEIIECNSIPLKKTKSLVGFNDVNRKQKWYYFDGCGYKTIEYAFMAAEARKEMLKVEIEKKINLIAYSIIPISKADDPYWDDSARELLMAILYRFIELIDELNLSKKKFNFKNIINVATAYSAYDLEEFFEKAPMNSFSMQLANKILKMSAQTTKSCIFGSLSNKLAQFKSYGIQKITLDNTVDFSKFDEKPTALFLCVDDMDKACYTMLKLVITDLYQALDKISEKNEDSKLSRPFDFVLDEFCNIPVIDNFSNMISTSRSKDIWFTLVVQAYSQLDQKYGESMRDVILNNVNMEVFFGTNDYKTKEMFSLKCGKNTKVSPFSYYNAKDESIERYDRDVYQIVTVSDLSIIPEDTCYIRYINYPIFHSVLTRYYKVKEFKGEKTSISNKFTFKSLEADDYSFNYMSELEKQRKAAIQERNARMQSSKYNPFLDDVEDDKYKDADEDLDDIKKFLESLDDNE